MPNKRLIILIAVIVGIIIIAGVVLWLIFAPEEVAPIVKKEPQEEIITAPIVPPAEAEYTIFKLSDTAAVSPALSGNKVLYYSKTNGIVWENDFENKSPRSITNVVIPDIISAVWSPDRTLTISAYQEKGAVKKVLFDFISRKASQLDARIKSINFAQDQNKVAYQMIDSATDTNAIYTSDPDGLNSKNIFSTRSENLKIYWPAKDMMAFATSPSGLVHGSAFTKKISDLSSGLSKLASGIYGLTIKFSPKGDKVLYSQTDQYGHTPRLSLIKNEIAQNLNINTLSDKCAFAESGNIYCAVPRVINGSLVLPDDFYKNTADFSDVFFKIDASVNRSAMLLDPRDFKYDFNASDIIISPNEDYLIFINKKDGLLYSIRLK